MEHLVVFEVKVQNSKCVPNCLNSLFNRKNEKINSKE